MKPTCRKCHYYCLDSDIDYMHDHMVYDFSYSFCGLHGRHPIEDPDGTPPNLSNYHRNEHYDCMCGFIPLSRHKQPVQLSLF